MNAPVLGQVVVPSSFNLSIDHLKPTPTSLCGFLPTFHSCLVTLEDALYFTSAIDESHLKPLLKCEELHHMSELLPWDNVSYSWAKVLEIRCVNCNVSFTDHFILCLIFQLFGHRNRTGVFELSIAYWVHLVITRVVVHGGWVRVGVRKRDGRRVEGRLHLMDV
jgi:hypothetical protein